jgi:hypothetical protein
MLRNLFKRKASRGEGTGHRADADPSTAALHKAVAERKKRDPLAGLKIGGKEVTQRLIRSLRDEKGVHIETLLTILGALAGFSCQMSIREELTQQSGERLTNQPFLVVSGADGKNYYFGDALNRPLAESQWSIWALSVGAAQHMGSSALPDINDIFRHVSETVGSDRFGIPRVPESHQASDLPINFVKMNWPKMLPLVAEFCDRPAQWPVLLGIAIQQALYLGKGIIDPSLAVSIVMESAVPMSKIDAAELFGAV